MKAQVKHRFTTAQKLAATNSRNFRTFLLVSQFEAEAIGARIALARKERGMTQEELASVASFSKRSLQDYERGVTIPYKHLRELATILKRKTEWFLYGDPDESSSELQRLREEVEGIRADLAALRGDLHLDESA